MRKNKKREKVRGKKAVYCQNLDNKPPFLYLHTMTRIIIVRFSVASAKRRGGSRTASGKRSAGSGNQQACLTKPFLKGYLQ
jgi:hypothetical protein